MDDYLGKVLQMTCNVLNSAKLHDVEIDFVSAIRQTARNLHF